MKQFNEHHSFVGMQRDVSISKHPSSFLYDAKNIRLTSRNGDTLFAITNEKGTSSTNISLSGQYLGHCLLRQYLVVFTKSSSTVDHIYRIDLSTLESPTALVNDNLGFSTSHPIQAISSYENDNIQKVYWTDGNKQPRVINIAPYNDSNINNYTSKSFDFVRELQLQEQVNVTKILGSGEFPAGVIQYAMTYFNKFGQESNIFYTTPLLYITHKDRGGSPEDKIANSFKIDITNVDENFEYLRIYSILRTSVNSTPLVKRLQDIEIVPKEPALYSSNSKYTNGLGTLSGITEDAIHSIASMSTDGGASYVQIPSSVISPYDSTTGPFPIAIKDGVKDTWTTTMNVNSKAFACIFSKNDYPNLILRINGKYYTWGGSSYGTVNSQYIYLGLGTNSSAIVSDNGGAIPCNIFKYDSNPYNPLSFIDDGITGESIDPSELLYKGGEEITAKTISQKDGTLFLGNLSITRQPITFKQSILTGNGVSKSSPLASRNITSVIGSREFSLGSEYPFTYVNTLVNKEDSVYQGILGFKANEYYRLGVQFQYKNGKWSEPCWIGDAQCTEFPSINTSAGVLNIPEFRYDMHSTLVNAAYNAGYRKVRPLFAVSRIQDRTIICQGIACPTMYRKVDRWSDSAEEPNSSTWTDGSDVGTLYSQSSWLFRTKCPSTNEAGGLIDYTGTNGGGKVTPSNRLESQYDIEFSLGVSSIQPSPYLRSTEVMGKYDDGHAFYIDSKFVTIHSPELVFDGVFNSYDFNGCELKSVGNVQLDNTYGDIDIQLSTPPIGSDSAGFVHRSIKTDGYSALITGLFYEDYLVDDTDDTPTYGAYQTDNTPVLFPVYMWHKNGSINNDVPRSNRSAELLKKKISNYRLGGNTTYYNSGTDLEASDMQLFNSSELTMIKVNGKPYRGNIETMITPDSPSDYYICGSPYEDSKLSFLTPSYYKLAFSNPNDTSTHHGLWEFDTNSRQWNWNNGSLDDIGDYVKGLCQWREGISMKYKSTPHLVVEVNTDIFSTLPQQSLGYGKLPLVEVTKPYNKDVIFGGTSDDALQANVWIPCGPAISLNYDSTAQVDFKWGDTYFQRYECLKTYPFTMEDKNQVVEIASFMVETRVNIDGRYDRNRGQASNLNVSPSNFNLLNPVYSQQDNFFSYRILDDKFYEFNTFPNQFTWTKEKQSGADIDAWTNITLANIYDMDGSKGSIVSLNTWKDQIYCFQNKGVSNILFNSRVQIPASDGIPIEISNSYKVDGYRYISDGIGCNDMNLIKETPSGIYFVDSISKHLYHIGNDIQDVSSAKNMTSWFNASPSISKIAYDEINHDIYLVTSSNALCFSEVLGQFTSFMDYGNIPFIESYGGHVFTLKESSGTCLLYKLFEGNYNYFFTQYKPWYFTFISNGLDAGTTDFDKIFSTLDYRMDMYSSELTSDTFSYIKVTNEYQDTGDVSLSRAMLSSSAYNHSYNLEKKFRNWRIQIPRNNNSLDRIRNTWCKITLGNTSGTNKRAIFHDLNVQYFI